MKITIHNYKNTSPNCENTTWIWIEYYYGIIKRYYTIYSMHLPCDVEANDNFLCFENYYYLHYCIPCTKTILDIAPIDVAIRKNDSFFLFFKESLVPSKSHKVNFKPREYITSLHLLSHFILSPRTHCNRESRPSRIPITTILMVCQRALDMMVSPSSPRCSLDFSFVVFSATMQSWFLIRIVELFWPMRSGCYLSSWRIVARCQHTLAEPLAPFPLMLCLTASAVGTSVQPWQPWGIGDSLPNSSWEVLLAMRSIFKVYHFLSWFFD